MQHSVLSIDSLKDGRTGHARVQNYDNRKKPLYPHFNHLTLATDLLKQQIVAAIEVRQERGIDSLKQHLKNLRNTKNMAPLALD